MITVASILYAFLFGYTVAYCVMTYSPNTSGSWGEYARKITSYFVMIALLGVLFGMLFTQESDVCPPETRVSGIIMHEAGVGFVCVEVAQ